jgi:hypothetical protein
MSQTRGEKLGEMIDAWHARHERKEGEPEPPDPDKFVQLQEALDQAHADIFEAIHLLDETKDDKAMNMLQEALEAIDAVWRDLNMDQLPIHDIYNFLEFDIQSPNGQLYPGMRLEQNDGYCNLHVSGTVLESMPWEPRPI